MKITITTTLEVSEQNIWLVPVIISKNGGKSEAETNNEAIERICNDYFARNTKALIEPHMPAFFGEMNKEMSDAVIEQLGEAITVNTSIDV